MRFLVTGATGFIGGAIARRLLDEGEEVRVLVRDRDRAGALAEAGADVHVGIIGDPNAIADAARDCEALIHAAAVRSHRAAPRALSWVNVAGTENVINAARHVGCPRLVLISCADVTLTNADRVNWNEDRDLTSRPLDAHARSKRVAEEIALSTELEVVALRPAWIWGPGDTSLLPAFCREGLDGGFRLVGNGENLISTTYIDHLVDAVLSAAEVTTAVGRPYYITDDELIEAREFFGQLSQAAGVPAPRRGPPYGLAYVLSWVRARTGGAGAWPTDVILRGRPTHFDVHKARMDLDWEPRVSLEEGMRRVAAWVKEQGGPESVANLGSAPATAESVDDHATLAGGEERPSEN